MKIPLVRYEPGEKLNGTWIRYFLRRIEQNKNNLVTIVGQTGSSKTWSGMSICEMISKKNGVPFGVNNIVFTLREFLELINKTGKERLRKGSCIIFDEPQVTISNKEFMSKANKIFNYIASTFRHRNLNVFFCTPYEDLLDLSTRKLFHAKFETVSINKKEQTAKLNPKVVIYNSQKRKFYECWIRRQFIRPGKNRYVIEPLKRWSIPKPSKDLIKAYELKKKAFTTDLNKGLEKDLNAVEFKEIRSKLNKILKRILTERQLEAYNYFLKNIPSKIAYKKMGVKYVDTFNLFLRKAKERIKNNEEATK